MPLTLTCPDARDTFRLGERIGASCRRGMVIALSGDLGSGKTTFVQGLAAGLGVPPEYRVTSPSYTLVNEYPGRIPLAHADLYRLAGETAIEDIGLEDLICSDVVLAVEWPERMPPDALSDCLEVRFSVRDDDARDITISAYGLEPRNLLEAISTNDN